MSGVPALLADLLFLSLAARLQGAVAPAPLLAAAGFVLAFRRPVAEAAVCLLWTGLFYDALDCEPILRSASYFLVLFGVFRLARVTPLPPFGPGAVLAGAFFCAGLSVWHLLFGAPFRGLALALQLPLGVLAVFAAAVALHLTDRFSGRFSSSLKKKEAA